MINISAKDKDSTKKRTSGLYCQISKWFKNKFSDKGLLIRNIEFSDCCCTLHADTHSQSCSCPNCGRLCYHVHKYYIRTLESLELFNLQVVIQVRVRYYYCDYPDCPQRTFSGSLAIAGPNARKTHEVQQRILKTSLYLSGRKASLLLKSQNIHASTSGCTRVVKRLGESNPPCTSTRIGIDDFASKKGHVYKCVACDQDTGFPVAIFDCRYGEELNQWLQENQQIELVTRDGSHDYARAISTHLPRASVQQVYGRIMEDLDEAITLLTGASARADKAEISVEVAYGLRARANLLMGKWAAAASDAAKAYGTSAPYSVADVSQPTFYNATDNAWIWGIVVTTEDYLAKTGIVNWPSNLCSLTGMGYTTAASATDVAYRLINKNLWAKIPETDVRKGWWVDEDLHSPVLDNGLGEDYAYYWANGMFNGGTFPSKFSPYTNVKFGPDNGTFADTDNAQDWPLMRVEEMKLIEAEALGRDNLATGKQKLEEFVRQYRDPSYTCTAGSLDAFIDEVWFQRRIELWGEGFALFDILRLKKPIIRQGANYPINSTFAEIAAEAPIMIYRIPEAETSVNSAITEADNNPAAMAPTPVN